MNAPHPGDELFLRGKSTPRFAAPVRQQGQRKVVLIVCAAGAVGLLLIAGVVLLAVHTAGLLGRPAAPAEIAAQRWQPYAVPGRCKALFPGTPTRRVQNQGIAAAVIYLLEPDKDSTFVIGYSESMLPAHRRNLPPEQVLTDACNGALANLAAQGGREVKREPIQLGPYPGMQMKAYLSNARGYLISRFYLAHGRLYMAICGGTGYDDGQPNVKRFFDSFEILDTGALR
jgi:hypothetical protein